MAHDVVENNPKKEIMYSLVGVAMFAGIVALIAISAYLRPAGNHVDVKKLNAEAEAKAAASATAATTTAAAAAPVSGAATTANADKATGPDTTVASPDKAKMASASTPKETADAGVASPAAVADRKAKTADAKQDIKELNKGKTPNIDVPVTENDSKTGEAKVTSKVPAAQGQDKAKTAEVGQATK